jgi:hypothetical protein
MVNFKSDLITIYEHFLAGNIEEIVKKTNGYFVNKIELVKFYRFLIINRPLI